MLYEVITVWLWLYLALAVSSTMFPSSSDRRPMTKLLIGLVLLLALIILFGAGVWLLDLVGPGVSRTLGAASLVCGMSVGLHIRITSYNVCYTKLLRIYEPEAQADRIKILIITIIRYFI